MTDWQPIATAPKDGTKILGYGKGTSLQFDDSLMNVIAWSEDCDGHWCLINVATDDCETHPTHWTPLPPPPETA